MMEHLRCKHTGFSFETGLLFLRIGGVFVRRHNDLLSSFAELKGSDSLSIIEPLLPVSGSKSAPKAMLYGSVLPTVNHYLF